MKRRVLSAFIIILVVVMMLGTISVSAYTYEYDVDMYKFSTLVVDAEKFEFEHYNTTALTWAIFQQKVNNARFLLNSGYAVSQDNIDLAYNELQQAIENLGPSNYVEPDIPATESVNKSELELLIVEAKSWKKTEYDVANWEWSNFLAEIEMANAVFESDGSTQSEVDYAKKNLSNAMNEMRSKKITNQTPDFETTPIETMPSIQTERPIETVYIPQTEKPKETLPKSTAPLSQGGFIEINCGSSIAISALAIVGIIGAALTVKKKED